MESILARASIGISELKMNPMAAIEQADGPVAILNRNKPVAYLIPASEWEAICDRLEDIELAEIARSRMNDGDETVSVKLEDL
ncbi:type II toxin-antitoxin system Phd/YefM family antitoxin [Paraburkholderia bannensis]|uniref:type II toxin-antitoxin system Phd/YefM family antitoxin n=1 Tax=Paraburkholderia bannensis TaxID=765414 RepID=UPI002ABD1844|nr:type II toxin-antitoxin system Phd/YefM family antitoxin [Paraburkholderia bannensis]